MEQSETVEPGHAPAEAAARPLATLAFALMAFLALSLSLFGVEARHDLALQRRGSESRLDPGLARLQPLILPAYEAARKAQGVKLQPKPWMMAGGDAALLPVILPLLLALSGAGAVLASAAPGLTGKPEKTHPARAPPADPFLP